METFGVTLAMITGTVSNLALDPNSLPSPTYVDEVIDRAAAAVVSEAKVKGITSWEVDDLTYRNLQSMVLFGAIAEILASKDRGMERANYYQTRYNQLRAQLREAPSSIGPDSATNKRNAVAVYNRELSGIDRLGLARRLMY